MAREDIDAADVRSTYVKPWRWLLVRRLGRTESEQYVQWIGRAARPGYEYETGCAYTLIYVTLREFFEART